MLERGFTLPTTWAPEKLIVYPTPDTDLQLDDELPADGERELRVFAWRLDQLLRAGYEADDATVLAVRLDVDLHAAIDLVGRGCAPGTAVRILL